MANDINYFGDPAGFSPYQPDTSNIEQDPSYTEGAGLLDTQQTTDQATLGTQRTGVVNSYAESRQNSINAYQDALDQINYGMRQVGIRVQAGSAQRGLYNASGELSGIGQNVASNAIEPLVRQTRIAGERQAQNLSNLNTNERNALQQVDDAIAALPGKTAKAKADLKAKITQSILDAADKKNKQDLDLAKFNLDVTQENRMARSANVNIPGTPEFRQKIKVEQQEKGREHLDSAGALQRAAAAKRTIITVNGMKFALSPKEEADLKNIDSTIKKRNRAPSAPSVGGGSFKTDASGGRAYFDKKGKPITASKYAKDNNKSLIEVLPSNDPFIESYNRGMEAIGGYDANGNIITKAQVLAELKEGFQHLFD